MSQKLLFKFINADMQVSPDAYELIKTLTDKETICSSIITHIKGKGIDKKEMTILTKKTLEDFLKSENIAYIPQPTVDSSINTEKDIKINSEITSPEVETKTEPHETEGLEDENISAEIVNPEIRSKGLKVVNPNQTFDFEILQDTSKKSYTSGEISDMITYFNDRYQKLKKIITKRREYSEYTDIIDLDQVNGETKIICMIREYNYTKNGHKILTVEDETGTVKVLIHNSNEDLINEFESIVNDEVIGLSGIKKGELFIVNDFMKPGIPRSNPEKEMNFSAVFISDVHIGSQTFLHEVFNNFISWLNCEYGSDEQIEIAKDVKYLVIAGDIVDGIGIYPNQEDELEIKDVTQQYNEAARLLSQIREDIKIIIAPGNHDASRVAEPQPAVPEEYGKALYELTNVEFVSNPALISLDGIKTLIYHGRSFDDFAISIKGFSHQESDKIMKELLEKRHLAPIYGERTPLASELEDHLVIQEIPQIFHTGHVHINSYAKYNGIHLINSGTFQTQTEFQKIHNIEPTAGEVPVIHRGKFKLLKFKNDE